MLEPTSGAKFQSAPGAQAGRNVIYRAAWFDSENVSIRPRRSGREELIATGPPNTVEEFQSAPGAQAGRNVIAGPIRRMNGLFQSAPAAQAGRNLHRRELLALDPRVSIRPRQLRPGGTPRPAKSIVRLQPGFNPPPAAQAGRNDLIAESAQRKAGFNPPPALRPGGT